MKKNRKGDMTPYDLNESPLKQNLFLMPIIWLACWFLTRPNRLNIKKINMEGLKPPFLVLSEHHGFADYYIAPLALFPHRANYVSDIEGFAAFGRGLYRAVGCIPTRRFVSSVSLVKNVQKVLQKKGGVAVIFPEARHSNVGTNSVLPGSIGKLVRLLKVPVVILKIKGSYLDAPIWDEHRRRNAPLEAQLEKLLDTSDIEEMSAEEITDMLNKKFSYDEYRWQHENKIAIEFSGRAEGLHTMLYQCPQCKSSHTITSHQNELLCNVCGCKWQMDQWGSLITQNEAEQRIHIPDWYESQRISVSDEIDSGNYYLNLEVEIEALPNHKGFVSLGSGTLTHTAKGFTVEIPNTFETLHFPTASLPSVHTECNYHEKGDCLVLSTRSCCYYLYAKKEILPLTKIQFAAEDFYTRQLYRESASLKC